MRSLPAILLLCLLPAPRAWSASAAATLAVVGFRAGGAAAQHDPWLGVAVAEGVAARLTGLGTGLAQVERVDVATVLRQQGLPAVDLDTADAAARGRAVAALVHLAAQPLTPPVPSPLEPTPSPVPPPRLLVASHLVLGDVVTEKPWGQGGSLLATVRVVRVATGAVLDDSGAVVRGEASVAGLQQLQCQLAARLCLALGGDISRLDLQPHLEQPEVVRRYGQARRAVLEGQYDRALVLSQAAWREASVELLPGLMRTQAEAYQGAIAQARETADQATTDQLRAQWRQQAVTLLAAYDQATLQAKQETRVVYAAAAAERGHCLWTQERYGAAVPEYQEALTHGYSAPLLRLYLGFALLVTGQAEAAREHLEAFVAQRPAEPAGYAARALCQAWTGRHGEALRDYDTLAQLVPEAAPRLRSGMLTALVGRGTEALQRGELPAAGADLDRAVALAPDYLPARLNRAALHLARRDYAAALTDYDQALRLQPDSAEALVGRATARCQQGDLDGARADCQRAMTLAPDHPGVQATLAWVHYRHGDLAAALRLAEAAAAQTPDQPHVRGNLALVRLALGQTEAAVAGYRELARQGPQALRGVDCQGDLTELLARQPECHAALFCLGLVTLAEGRKTESRAAFEAYLQAAPQGPYVAEARRCLAEAQP